MPRSLRVKGIFRVHQKTWVAVSAAPEAGGAGACHQPGTEPADGDVAWAEGAGAAAVQLTEVAYRRDSRVEVILEVAACCGSLAQQAAAVGLEEPGAGSDEGSGTPTGQAVDAALRHGASGDWEALEALVIVTLAD